jgi:GTPase SAR1 family protein
MHTISVEFFNKTIPTLTDDHIKAQIWDINIHAFKHNWIREISSHHSLVTAFLSLSHYRQAIGNIVVYDITKENTFKDGIAACVQEVHEYADPSVEIFLFSNKNDLPYRTISRYEGQRRLEFCCERNNN